MTFSTDYVFDGRKRSPYVESDGPNPASAYGRTKLHGEAAAGPNAWVVRTSWLFGPTGHNFLRTMLRLGAERDEVAVVDDQRGCPTYVGHLAAAVRRARRRRTCRRGSGTSRLRATARGRTSPRRSSRRRASTAGFAGSRRPSSSVLPRGPRTPCCGASEREPRAPALARRSSRMPRRDGRLAFAPMRLLVTGGAGFIGSNFVHYWLERHPRRPGRRLRPADLRREPREPRGGRGPHRVRPGRHLRSRARRGDAARARDRGRRQLRRRVAQLARRRRPDAVLPHERPRHADAARRVACRRRRALPPRLDLRGVRRSRARHGRGVHRGVAVSAAHAVQRVEGGRRPRRPRVLRDLRSSGHDHELLEQLRPVPVPREGHPALHDERARRRAAPDVRLDAEQARVAARPRPLRGDRPRAAGGTGGRDVQRRLGSRGDDRGDRRPRARADRQAGRRSRRSSRTAPATTGATSSTPRRSRTELGLGAGARLRGRACAETVAWYEANRDWWEPLKARAPVEESAWK